MKSETSKQVIFQDIISQRKAEMNFKIQNDIDKNDQEASWIFCYNKVLIFIKPVFYKLLRGVTSVGNVLTGIRTFLPDIRRHHCSVL